MAKFYYLITNKYIYHIQDAYQALLVSLVARIALVLGLGLTTRNRKGEKMGENFAFTKITRSVDLHVA